MGQTIGEPLDVFGHYKNKTDRQERITYLLEKVGLQPQHAWRYPHEFSGGQRQRIGVARSLACNSSLIICDEPVSALDVSIQAQVINLLEDLQDQFGFAYLFIAHDLGVVKYISDRIIVMYLGKIFKIAYSKEIYENPRHPYTEALLAAISKFQAGSTRDILLKGSIPDPSNPPDPDGNILLNLMAGAEIIWITPDEYRQRDELMSREAASLKETWRRPFSD